MFVFRLENHEGLGPIHGYRILRKIWVTDPYTGERYLDEETERLMDPKAFISHPTGSQGSRYLLEYGNYYRFSSKMKFGWKHMSQCYGFINPKLNQHWKRLLHKKGFRICVFEVSRRHAFCFNNGQVMIPKFYRPIRKMNIR